METKILIVDDELENFNILKRFLKNLGERYNPLNILKATNGVQAISVAKIQKPNLILMDWHMPLMDGLEALKILKSDEETKDIPTVIITNYENPEYIAQALENGADDFVHKNSSQIEQLARVRAVLKAHRVYQENEKLLNNIFPKDIVQELRTYNQVEVKKYEMVSIIFADFVGFTDKAATIDPEDLIAELDFCFEKFDEIIDRYNVEKIKTIGDAYMCAGGIPKSNTTNAIETVLAGLEMQKFIEERYEEKNKKYWRCRLGINTGGVVAGVIGKKRLAYDIWGDAVNVAARMESNGELGKVNIGEATYAFVKDFFECQKKEPFEVKGKGKMQSYLVNNIRSELSENNDGLEPNKYFWEMLNSEKQSLEANR